MKPSFALAAGLFGAFVLLPTHARAQAGADRVRIEVVVQSSLEHKEAAKTAKEEKEKAKESKTEEKWLTITVTGKPKSPETRKAKWIVYGHTLGKDSHGVTATESGEFTLELPANGIQKLETKKVTFTSTPEHSEGKGKSAKRVEASGSRFGGYSVQVKDGETVVGETSDPVGVLTPAK